MRYLDALEYGMKVTERATASIVIDALPSKRRLANPDR